MRATPIYQYQRNARQSANMQERDRGQSIQQMGFMNVEQRMATPFRNLRIADRT